MPPPRLSPLFDVPYDDLSRHDIVHINDNQNYLATTVAKHRPLVKFVVSSASAQQSNGGSSGALPHSG